MKTKFFPYTLTIGMMVKNDAHRLRACLDGLAPLRKALSCELILTDLGSTDGTQEIAKEYADVYLEHEWSDDFAKARNTGVTASKGRWFFYVDADFQFDETILDIATFLSDKKQSKIYNSATVTLENHVKKEEETEQATSSFYHIQRGLLVNFSGGKRFFKGAVHESIPTHGVAYPLKTMIKRTVKEDCQEEKEQNLVLLQQQLEKEPEDLTRYIELSQELKDPAQKRLVFERGFAKSKTLSTSHKDNVLWAAILHSRYLLFALQEEDWDLFDSLVEDWSNPFPGSIIDLNVKGMELSAVLKQRFDDTLMELFQSYQDLFYQLKQTPDQIFSMIESFTYARAPFFYSVESNAIRCAVAYQMKDLSKEWLTKSDTYSFVHSNGTRAYLANFCECAMITEQFALIRKTYDYLKDYGSPRDVELLFKELQSSYENLQSYDRFLFAQEMEGVDLPFSTEEEPEPEATPEPVVAPVPEPVVAPVSEPVVTPVPEPVVAPVPEPVVASVQEPSLEEVKQTLLSFLQQGDVNAAIQLLTTAKARFPQDPTLQALGSKLGL